MRDTGRIGRWPAAPIVAVAIEESVPVGAIARFTSLNIAKAVAREAASPGAPGTRARGLARDDVIVADRPHVTSGALPRAATGSADSGVDPRPGKVPLVSVIALLSHPSVILAAKGAVGAQPKVVVDFSCILDAGLAATSGHGWGADAVARQGWRCLLFARAAGATDTRATAVAGGRWSCCLVRLAENTHGHRCTTAVTGRRGGLGLVLLATAT